MNRRGFIRTFCGGVAAALGIALAPKPFVFSQQFYLKRSIPKPLVIKNMDANALSRQLVLDAKKHLEENPSAMERLLAYVDEPRDRITEMVERLYEEPNNFRPLSVHTQKVNWHSPPA